MMVVPYIIIIIGMKISLCLCYANIHMTCIQVKILSQRNPKNMKKRMMMMDDPVYSVHISLVLL